MDEAKGEVRARLHVGSKDYTDNYQQQYNLNNYYHPGLAVHRIDLLIPSATLIDALRQPD